MTDKCDRCQYTQNLESHHIKHRAEGGTDDAVNLVTLCRACHDYQHAKENVIKAINAERERLAILLKRLELIEGENAIDTIRSRGYQSYFEIFKEGLPPQQGCKKV